MVIKHKFSEHSETLKLKDAEKKPMILSVRVIKDVKRNHSLYEFSAATGESFRLSREPLR